MHLSSRENFQRMLRGEQPWRLPLDLWVTPPAQDLIEVMMIGTQTTMPIGTPADVRAAVHELAEFARGGARLVVAPTHVLEPDVPWKNIRALVDAVIEERLCHDLSRT